MYNLHVLGHFRIVLCLFFKARPRAKPFIWKWVFSACEWKLIFIWKAMHQDSLWERGTRQLGNGQLLWLFLPLLFIYLTANSALIQTANIYPNATVRASCAALGAGQCRLSQMTSPKMWRASGKKKDYRCLWMNRQSNWLACCITVFRTTTFYFGTVSPLGYVRVTWGNLYWGRPPGEGTVPFLAHLLWRFIKTNFPTCFFNQCSIFSFMYCLINEQECFIGFKTTRRSRVVLDPIKHDLRVYWTASKNDLIE